MTELTTVVQTTVVPGTIKFRYNSASTNPFTYTKDGRENTGCEKKFQIKNKNRLSVDNI